MRHGDCEGLLQLVRKGSTVSLWSISVVPAEKQARRDCGHNLYCDVRRAAEMHLPVLFQLPHLSYLASQDTRPVQQVAMVTSRFIVGSAASLLYAALPVFAAQFTFTSEGCVDAAGFDTCWAKANSEAASLSAKYCSGTCDDSDNCMSLASPLFLPPN